MPTTLNAVVRRSERATQSALTLAAISMLTVAVVFVAIQGLSSSDAAQRLLTPDLGIAVPP